MYLIDTVVLSELRKPQRNARPKVDEDERDATERSKHPRAQRYSVGQKIGY